MAVSLASIEINAENVEQAVLQFYQSKATQETHQWLTVAQISPQAWNFSWELMQQNKAPEVQFFGASCLALKVSRGWNELKQDQIPTLRKKLLDTVVSYTGPKIVLTRICVAVSGLVIHSIGITWQNPIQDLMNMLQPLMTGDNIRPLLLLLELLTVIPEDFSTILLSSQRRSQVRQSLSLSLKNIIQFLIQVLSQQNNSEISRQACKSIQAWVQFGVPLEESEELIQRLLAAVHDEELADVAFESLSSMVTHPDTHKYPRHLTELLKRLLPLDKILYEYIAEGSYECAVPVLSLFISFGESHSRLLIDWSTTSEEGRQCVLKMITAILAASSCPAQYPTHETISEMPFGFWYILQDDIIACEPEQYQMCVALFGPVYTALVQTMLIKSMYDPNDNVWTADQRESFRCYRTDVADTIMYSFNILRDGLLQTLLHHLESSIKACLAVEAAWPALESCLHAWYAVAESLADSEEEEANPLLSRFLAKLPVIPFTKNMRVYSTVLDCIGGFSDWLAMHPQLLPHVTPIVTAALANPELSLAATMALKDISRDCNESMQPYAGDVIEAIHRAIQSDCLQTNEVIRLMYPLGEMLSLLPSNQILPRLEPIVAPQLQMLGTLGTSANKQDQQVRAKVIFVLKLMTTLFQTLNISRRADDQPECETSRPTDSRGEPAPQPVFVIVKQCMPMLTTICQHNTNDAEIINSVCALLKQTVSTLKDEIKPLAEDVVNLTMACYRVSPQPSALDLVKQFFILYGREASMEKPLKGLLCEVNSLTIRTIQSGATLSDNTDLIDCFFGMLSQVLKKQVGLFVNNEMDSNILVQCAIHSLMMPEQHPVKSAASFLTQLVTVSRDIDSLVPLINTHGESLFTQIMRCIGGEANRTFLDYFTDILLALNKKYFDNLCRYMNTMVTTQNFPSEICTKEQKEVFARTVLRERANKRKLQETVREFSLVCRGLIGSEYASQLLQYGL